MCSDFAETAIEAVLLTGGKSSRMGEDKAALDIGGKPMAAHIAGELEKECNPVTVIGLEPISGYGFLLDQERFRGPLAAIATFSSTQPFVFIASCDMPLFESSVVVELALTIEEHEACIPNVNGRLQPLCALYRAKTLELAGQLLNDGERRLMAWVDCLNVRAVDAEKLANPLAVKSANTHEELKTLLSTFKTSS